MSINLLISWNFVAAMERTQPALYSPEGIQVDNYGALRTHVEPSPVYYELGEADAAVLPKMQRFFEAHSTAWEVRWDRRSDRPNLVQGVGVPMLPGKGNALTYEGIGVASAEGLTIEAVEGLVRGFMTEFSEIFDFPQDRLKLVPERSGNYGKDRQLWFVDFQQFENGVPVRDASMVFRINNGNLIQFGMERIAPVQISTTPALNKEDAFAKVLEFTGFDVAEIAEVEWDKAAVEILPTMGEGQKPGEPYTGPVGQGYLHALVWRVPFQRFNDIRRYEALVDAQTGEVLQLGDTNDYLDALVQGGVFLESSRDPEVLKPFAHVLVKNNGDKYTNDSGVYNYEGGTARTNLIGRYVTFHNECWQSPATGPLDPNAILLDSMNGNLNFGTHSGTNCITPEIGRANTHAARNTYYHLTLINRKAATYLNAPPNDPNHWLNQQVISGVDYYDVNTCSAGHTGGPDPMRVLFAKSSQCTVDGVSDVFRNTGELADSVLHEYGHVMDSETGG
jgi:hypothetical protein